MKKISVFLSAIILFTGISFASSNQTKPDKPKTEKKTDKKTEKKEVKKVPARKAVKKADNTNTTKK
ncbi:MAG TPA: hypothetical protein VK783_09410 [Bacteroidia bacterium]|nr:hypothetical protein [Bacteroidia bacterium]